MSSYSYSPQNKHSSCSHTAIHVQLQLQPPKQAQFLLSHCTLHSGGAAHIRSTGYYAGGKQKPQSGKKSQQISFCEIEWKRVNLVTFSPEDYNGVIDWYARPVRRYWVTTAPAAGLPTFGELRIHVYQASSLEVSTRICKIKDKHKYNKSMN
jgi:hypothetical protein